MVKRIGGRYLVRTHLGTGAMGEVYLVTDEKLGSAVVLKMLRSEWLGRPSVRARFAREGRIQANLTHPNIVRAIDIVEEEDLLAIVMDYVEGLDLEQHVQDEMGGRLTLPRIQAVMGPVMDAVAFAHSRGVVHRDLKPSNILLDRSQGYETPKVTDFGIAKLLDDAEVGLTRAGSVMGTPFYMPPEQLRSSADVDHRADIYALGVILHELAAGERPHNPLSEYEVVAQVLNGVRLSALGGRVTGIPAAFDAVVSRATEPDPAARFQTVGELAAALAHCCDHPGPVGEMVAPPPVYPPTPAMAPPDNQGPSAPQSAPQRPTALWFGGALGGALAIIAGGGLVVLMLVVVWASQRGTGDSECQEDGHCGSGETCDHETGRCSKAVSVAANARDRSKPRAGKRRAVERRRKSVPSSSGRARTDARSRGGRAEPLEPTATDTPPRRVRGYLVYECKSIESRSTGLQWYVGPNWNVSWSDARSWAVGLRACGGGWRLPSQGELKTLFDRSQSAGSGWLGYPARMDPVFAGIGGGSWIWTSETKGSQARPYNAYIGKSVSFQSKGQAWVKASKEPGTVRAFAVRGPP
jgi:serine/threonine-protein kinase